MKAYTSGDVAKICGVSLRTVIRWIEKGELKGFKLPGRGNNRVSEDNLINFLKAHDIPLPEELFSPGKNLILIVDDEPAAARAIQRVLKGAGYETKIAANGFEAGSLLTELKPAVMTLDLNMPGLNGEDVISYVRHADHLISTRILVVSGTSDSALERAVKLGADSYLHKPYANSDLLKQIEQLMESSQEKLTETSRAI
ncbi:response regulator [Neptuniibacter sp. PT8_73]|uniref:response regulator n=1 Tax=unclassified Neptuniibacter TaxID=2630693 RepID=UPI0039F667CA